MREWLRSALDFLGAGNLVVAIVCLVATPFVDRLLIRRKRLSFRIDYNSKIGLNIGGGLTSDALAGTAGAPQLARLSQLLDRMSIVVIRIRNSGSYDIDPDDYEHPLSFTFGERLVWNARVSEAANDAERERLRASLRFFRRDPPDGGPDDPSDRASLPAVRDWLSKRLNRLLVPAPAGPRSAEEPEDPGWHGVRLEGLALRRRQQFKLAVVLREPDGRGITKTVRHSGRLRDNGIIKQAGPDRFFTLQRVTGVLATLLTGLLVVALILEPDTKPDPGVGCRAGDLTVVGSTVFIPTMHTLAADYMARCPDAHIRTEATGSLNGVREVSGLDPASAGSEAASADGKQTQGATLYSEQLAVVVYNVVVHSSASVTSLSTAQLQGIFDGTYTDWKQLRGGESLPIRIVGRGSESGSRELFENDVLHHPEGELTSDDCRTPRVKDSATTVIRCERSANDEVVQTVGSTLGAIGYADTGSITEAHKTTDLTAVALDGRVFNAADPGYPFWTVEYLYTRGRPAGGSLLADFISYLHTHEAAQKTLKEAGYLPCRNPDGAPLTLCNQK